MEKISKKIHFIFLSKDEQMPEIFVQCFETAKELHPDWEVYVHDENDALRIVQEHFPELENLYRSFPLNIQRSNIFRILLLYLYGGFYLDLDVYCLKKLDPLLKYDLVLGVEKELTPEICTVFDFKNPKRIADYMFGSIPGHPFWLDFLNEIIEKSSTEIRNENDVLKTTGAVAFTNFYHAKTDLYKNIVLLPNIDRYCVDELHTEVSCHFGNYAAHIHTGSWRPQIEAGAKQGKENYQNSPSANLENFVKYEIKNDHYRNFYLYEDFTTTDGPGNQLFTGILKKSAIVLSSLEGAIDGKVILYGPLENFVNRILPPNEYLFCDTAYRTKFDDVAIDFINKNFTCCIVTTGRMKDIYKLNGITTKIRVMEPGFVRYKRNMDSDRVIGEFKVGVLASQFDEKMINGLLRACLKLRSKQIPSIKIKLYDPHMKFKAYYPEFRNSGVVEYISLAVSPDFFSGWFADLASAILGYTNEAWPAQAMEFLYLGIPIIVPHTDNYIYTLNKLNTIPAVFLSSSGHPTEQAKGNFKSENIQKVIFHLYRKYGYYSANAAIVAEELEDLYTTEDIQQKIYTIVAQT